MAAEKNEKAMPWRVVGVKGDGQCFYHALLYVLSEAGVVSGAVPDADRQDDWSESSSVVLFDERDVRGVKRCLLRCLRGLCEGDGVSETAVAALEAAMEGEQDVSAPLLERLTLSPRCCDHRFFATDAEVMLAARAFKVCICVHQEGGVVSYLPDLSSAHGAPAGRLAVPVVHLRSTRDHFDALVPSRPDGALRRSRSWPEVLRAMACGQ